MSSPKSVPVPGEVVDPAPKPVRRTFTAEYRNRIVDEYERAPRGEKSAVLRREGLYQSQLREWAAGRETKRARRPHRRGSVLASDGDQVLRRENDRLIRENARLATQVTQTEAALEIMGKLHVLLESISTSTGTPPPPRTP